MGSQGNAISISLKTLSSPLTFLLPPSLQMLLPTSSGKMLSIKVMEKEKWPTVVYILFKAISHYLDPQIVRNC